MENIIELENALPISVNEFAGNLMIEQNSDDEKTLIILPLENVKNMIDILKQYL